MHKHLAIVENVAICEDARNVVAVIVAVVVINIVEL